MIFQPAVGKIKEILTHSNKKNLSLQQFKKIIKPAVHVQYY